MDLGAHTPRSNQEKGMGEGGNSPKLAEKANGAWVSARMRVL
jgi:hypothetical protein